VSTKLSIVFRKRKISDEPYEACSAFDVDNDGIVDIVSGAYWYEGPDFNVKHKICEVASIGEYHDDFCDYPMDIDGDGHTDIVTVSFWSPAVRWRRNPGRPGVLWETFDIGPSSDNETLRFYDIDGCGVPEIFSNAIREPQKLFKLIVDANGKGTGTFAQYVIGEEEAGHGLGFADVNGDGRMDVVLANGWLEQPEDPFGGLVDLDGDGKLELVTGKRYRAHNDGDPGAFDPVGLYYYKIEGGRFEKHVIDFGPADEGHSGAGIFFWIQDLTGNGFPDIVAPGKDGLYLFENLGTGA
jgi:hypothetical protein